MELKASGIPEPAALQKSIFMLWRPHFGLTINSEQCGTNKVCGGSQL